LRPDAFNRDHTRFRQYSSSPGLPAVAGRWSSPAPLAGDISDPQSLNRYSYVGNNPLAYTDPLGADMVGLCHSKGCIYDVASDSYTDQDLCAYWSTCDGYGGGGGGFSISINGAGLMGANGTFGETNGMPNGLHIAPLTLQDLVFRDPPCDFGICYPNNYHWNGSHTTVLGDYDGEMVCFKSGICEQWNAQMHWWNVVPRKKSAHENCTDAAYTKAVNDALSSHSENDAIPLKSAAKGAIGGAVSGCIATSAGGCLEGAIPSAATGLILGAIEGTAVSTYKNVTSFFRTSKQLRQNLAACGN
jgi:RHS repeat-associated protein